MGFSREKLLNWPFADVLQAYTQRDSILYALSLGFGSEPTNPQHLRFVYERGLESFPTMAVVLGHPGAWMADPETCIDLLRVLHGEQHLRLHRPLPPSGELRAVNRVTEVLDKGAGKGALITIERQLFDAAGGGDPYSTQQAVIFARGNGGFGGPTGPSRPPHPLPQREPDATVDIATLPQSALLYRLNGDYNPLHADPEVAARAGFPAPILHGLASFGIAARAVFEAAGWPAASRLEAIGLRFSAPVFPGESIRTELWEEPQGFSFRASVLERDTVVLNNGYARLRTS